MSYKNIAQILIVEDEPSVAGLLASTLRNAGFEATIAQNAQQALNALAVHPFDAAVVDWMMPGISGVELIRTLRQSTQTRLLPILMLTAKANENDKITGLEAGADDYLVKPFSPRELSARIKALLRRAQPLRDNATVQFGALALSPQNGNVVFTPNTSKLLTTTPKQVTLSHTEFKILHCMMLQPKRVHTREHLLAQAWDVSSQVDTRTIDAHIKRLRQALSAVECPPYIETVRGMGYKLSLD